MDKRLSVSEGTRDIKSITECGNAGFESALMRRCWILSSRVSWLCVSKIKRRPKGKQRKKEKGKRKREKFGRNSEEIDKNVGRRDIYEPETETKVKSQEKKTEMHSSIPLPPSCLPPCLPPIIKVA